MEDETASAGLTPWILAPLVLLVVLFFAMILLPENGCEGGEDWLEGSGRIAFGSIAVLASLSVAVAGILRLVEIGRRHLLKERDTWLLAAVLLVAGIGAGIGSDTGAEEALAGFLLSGLLLAIPSLIALFVAALKERTPDEVGILVPVYLFGMGMGYLLLAWVVLDLNAGALC
jgi:hypothetical protein